MVRKLASGHSVSALSATNVNINSTVDRECTVNQSIEQRMQSVEDQLKEIRKELEEGLARYKDKSYPFNADLDPRTATGYGLRYLAQEAGVDFDALDTDEQVRKSLNETNNT